MSGRAPVLLIHGWGFGPAVWSELVSCLRTEAPIIAPPLPGYGDKAVAEKNQASPLRELEVQLLELDQPAVIAGWSCGGLLALQLALSWPQRVRALVLIASLPCFRRGPDWQAGIAPAGLAAVRQRLQTDPGAALSYVSALSARGDDEAGKVRQTLNCSTPSSLSAAALKRDLDYLERVDLRASSPGDSAVHAVLGEHDQVIGADCGGALQAWCRHAPLHVVPGAGHAPMISRPEVVAGVLESLL